MYQKSKFTKDMIEYLISKPTLEAWSHMTLAQRSVAFHRQYPEVRISPSMLRLIYRKNGVTLKTKLMQKVGQSRSKPEDTLLVVADMQQQVQYCAEASIKIVFADECSFTIKHQMDRTWRGLGDAFEVHYPHYKTSQVSLLAGVSSQVGLEADLIKVGPIKKEDIVTFLQKLIESNQGQCIAVFLDNMAAHRSKVVTEFARTNNIMIIYNVPYACRLNGIEYCWRIVKQYFRRVLTQQLIARENIDMVRLVRESLQQLTLP